MSDAKVIPSAKVIPFPVPKRSDAHAIAVAALNLQRVTSLALLARVEVEAIQRALDHGDEFRLDPNALSELEQNLASVAANAELLRRSLVGEGDPR